MERDGGTAGGSGGGEGVAKKHDLHTTNFLYWFLLNDSYVSARRDPFRTARYRHHTMIFVCLYTGKLVNSFLPLLGIIYVSWAFAR